MTRARSLARLANENVFSVSTDNNVGVNSTSPVEKLNVVGVVSATSFYGDGSNLDGVSSAGLGTALDPDTAGLDVIYYTDKVLGVGATITIDPPSSTNIAYTQYSEVSVDDGFDIIIADGDEFIPDILGISTEGTSTIAGGVGGRIRAGYFTNKAGTGAPQLTFGAEVPVGYGITGAGGINITGVATATSFDGNATSATTATTATNAQGLTGTPDINVRNITGVAATFSGTLSYEDVTNIDAVGIVTAQSGVRVVGGGLSVTSGTSKLRGIVETVAVASTHLSGGGMVLEMDVAEATTFVWENTATTSGGNIGIVSFRNMPADEANGTTITLIHKQSATTPAGFGNTTAATGIGTYIHISPTVGGTIQAGIDTRGNIGSASTVTLSTTAADKDFVSFFIHYTGGGAGVATCFQTYVINNGSFRQGNIGV